MNQSKEDTMFALDTFVEAIAVKQYTRAANLANIMTDPIKDVAREIWNRWVPAPAPF